MIGAVSLQVVGVGSAVVVVLLALAGSYLVRQHGISEQIAQEVDELSRALRIERERFAAAQTAREIAFREMQETIVQLELDLANERDTLEVVRNRLDQLERQMQ